MGAFKPAERAADGVNRAAITVCVILATLMQALDTTIANVALPYMQGSVSASQTPQARRDSKIDWTSAAKDALLWVPAGGHGHPVKHLGFASRCAGLWVVRAPIPTPRTNGA